MKANSSSLLAVVEKAGVVTVVPFVDRSLEVTTSIAIDADAALTTDRSISATMTSALAEADAAATSRPVADVRRRPAPGARSSKDVTKTIATMGGNDVLWADDC